MSDDEAGNPDSPSEDSRPEQRQSERRRHLRFPFTASVEVIESESHAKVTGRTADLGLGGCYVDTINPLAVGTVVKIRLTKDQVTFEADGKVVFSQAGMGMGVAFLSAVPQQFRIFQKWLSQLTGESVSEQGTKEKEETNAGVANAANHENLVLGELVIALMRKQVLTDEEGKTMLQKLYGQG
ncbi:MAG TPA: PilZ domain-containing protein [Candidatus Acidoferrales bacterium]|nr:PilZ domain-containing protein [Candidatus Acidoferrales bacterium]